MPGRATPKEISLAEQLIEGMIAKWKPEKYQDTYRDTLLAAIRAKSKTGVLEAKNEPEHRAPAAPDLAALLEQSLAKRKKSREVA